MSDRVDALLYALGATDRAIPRDVSDWKCPLREQDRYVRYEAMLDRVQTNEAERCGFLRFYPRPAHPLSIDIEVLDLAFRRELDSGRDQSVDGYLVFGETTPGTLRAHNLVTKQAAEWRLLGRLFGLIANWIKFDRATYPQCLAHDDCAEVHALGVSCWREARGWGEGCRCRYDWDAP